MAKVLKIDAILLEAGQSYYCINRILGVKYKAIKLLLNDACIISVNTNAIDDYLRL